MPVDNRVGGVAGSRCRSATIRAPPPPGDRWRHASSPITRARPSQGQRSRRNSTSRNCVRRARTAVMTCTKYQPAHPCGTTRTTLTRWTYGRRKPCVSEHSRMRIRPAKTEPGLSHGQRDGLLLSQPGRKVLSLPPKSADWYGRANVGRRSCKRLERIRSRTGAGA